MGFRDDNPALLGYTVGYKEVNAMPFINIKTNTALDQEQRDELAEKMGQISRDCLGKGENWVMTGFEDGTQLHFQGSSVEPAAYVEVKLFGTAGQAACESMTAHICGLLEELLGVPGDRTYVAYFPTDNWGWNGGNF